MATYIKFLFIFLHSALLNPNASITPGLKLLISTSASQINFFAEFRSVSFFKSSSKELLPLLTFANIAETPPF